MNINDVYLKLQSSLYCCLFITIVPDDFPAMVNASVTSSRSVHVQWNVIPHISQNGIITKYEVTLSTNDENITEEAVELNITVGGLIPHTSYNITVRAFTRIGPGPSSTPIVILTFQDGMMIVNIEKLLLYFIIILLQFYLQFLALFHSLRNF